MDTQLADTTVQQKVTTNGCQPISDESASAVALVERLAQEDRFLASFGYADFIYIVAVIVYIAESEHLESKNN